MARTSTRSNATSSMLPKHCTTPNSRRGGARPRPRAFVSCTAPPAGRNGDCLGHRTARQRARSESTQPREHSARPRCSRSELAGDRSNDPARLEPPGPPTRSRPSARPPGISLPAGHRHRRRVGGRLEPHANRSRHDSRWGAARLSSRVGQRRCGRSGSERRRPSGRRAVQPNSRDVGRQLARHCGVPRRGRFATARRIRGRGHGLERRHQTEVRRRHRSRR